LPTSNKNPMNFHRVFFIFFFALSSLKSKKKYKKTNMRCKRIRFNLQEWSQSGITA